MDQAKTVAAAPRTDYAEGFAERVACESADALERTARVLAGFGEREASLAADMLGHAAALAAFGCHVPGALEPILDVTLRTAVELRRE